MYAENRGSYRIIKVNHQQFLYAEMLINSFIKKLDNLNLYQVQ